MKANRKRKIKSLPKPFRIQRHPKSKEDETRFLFLGTKVIDELRVLARLAAIPKRRAA